MTEAPKTGTEWLMQRRDRERAERVLHALMDLSKLTGIPLATLKRALVEDAVALMKDFPHD